MKIYYTLLLSSALSFLSPLATDAVNWIPATSRSEIKIDTDSIRYDKNIATMNFLFPANKHFVVSKMEFDSNAQMWCILQNSIVNESGEVSFSKESKNAQVHKNKITQGTEGYVLYQRFVAAPVPDISSMVWSPIKEGNTQYLINKRDLTYKDGYADFWLYAQNNSPTTEKAYTIYHVKMNIAYSRLKTLSATTYSNDHRIVAHLLGTPRWEAIPQDTLLHEIFLSIKKDVDQGILK